MGQLFSGRFLSGHIRPDRSPHVSWRGAGLAADASPGRTPKRVSSVLGQTLDRHPSNLRCFVHTSQVGKDGTMRGRYGAETRAKAVRLYMEHVCVRGATSGAAALTSCYIGLSGWRSGGADPRVPYPAADCRYGRLRPGSRCEGSGDRGAAAPARGAAPDGSTSTSSTDTRVTARCARSLARSSGGLAGSVTHGDARSAGHERTFAAGCVLDLDLGQREHLSVPSDGSG